MYFPTNLAIISTILVLNTFLFVKVHCWVFGEDGEMKPLKYIYIDFPKYNEPYCTVKTENDDIIERYMCRGKVGYEYPYSVTLNPNRHKLTNETIDGAKREYAIGPVEYTGTVYIYAGIPQEETGTATGAIVMNRWDLEELFEHFINKTTLTIHFTWYKEDTEEN